MNRPDIKVLAHSQTGETEFQPLRPNTRIAVERIRGERYQIPYLAGVKRGYVMTPDVTDLNPLEAENLPVVIVEHSRTVQTKLTPNQYEGVFDAESKLSVVISRSPYAMRKFDSVVEALNRLPTVDERFDMGEAGFSLSADQYSVLVMGLYGVNEP